MTGTCALPSSIASSSDGSNPHSDLPRSKPVPTGKEGLTRAALCSTFVLMEVETLGVARSLGWGMHMRCSDCYRDARTELPSFVTRVAAYVPSLWKSVHN